VPASPSAAVNVTTTGERYQFAAPRVPASAIVVTGATVSSGSDPALKVAMKPSSVPARVPCSALLTGKFVELVIPAMVTPSGRAIARWP
jgi:hypothetical protein